MAPFACSVNLTHLRKSEMKNLFVFNLPLRALGALLTLAALACTTTPSLAADGDYPTKPVSIIVAYAPGGQGDTFARLVSERLTSVYKQTVLVDNKPGVSGTVGTRLAVKARNDGYTLFLGQTGEIVVNRVLMKDLGYDPLKEMIPVVLIGNAPLVLLAPNDAPYNSLNELLQQARATHLREADSQGTFRHAVARKKGF